MSSFWRPTYRHVFAVLAALMSVYFGLRTSQAVLENQLLARQLAQQASQVRTIKQQNSDVASEIAYAETPAYVEGVARQQLGLMKPGDHVVQIGLAAAAGQPAAAPTPATPARGAAATASDHTPAAAPLPNWRRWLLLFADPARVAAPH